MTTSYIVIPARLASTRLPRKLLLRETGKSLIQHTYEAALRAKRPGAVYVATDHQEIKQEVESIGGRVIMTSPDLASGTERVAQAARQLPEADIIVNVQGDEPELAGQAIDQLIDLLDSRQDISLATLATPIRDRAQLQDPACVKVVFDHQQRALYFSRSPIPYPRDWNDALLSAEPPIFYQHMGIYAYRREVLMRLTELAKSRLEQVEKLEQLRFLEAGYAILVGVVEEHTSGIDTWADYQAFVRRHSAGRLETR
jgi:3-deoxy-manno-octulosonate cytidylyltransferase (CMP-KDO synthetase)